MGQIEREGWRTLGLTILILIIAILSWRSMEGYFAKIKKDRLHTWQMANAPSCKQCSVCGVSDYAVNFINDKCGDCQ